MCARCAAFWMHACIHQSIACAADASNGPHHVGNKVAIEVGGDHDIKLFGMAGELHAGVIYNHLLSIYAGIQLCCLPKLLQKGAWLISCPCAPNATAWRRACAQCLTGQISKCTPDLKVDGSERNLTTGPVGIVRR